MCSPLFPTGSLLHGRKHCPWELGVWSSTLFSIQDGPLAARHPLGSQKTIGHPEYKYAQPSMWLAAKPCRSQLKPWSRCCTTDRGGLGSEIHLQGVMSLWLRMGP